MILDLLVVGEIETNCYILGSETERVCAIIDPGGEPERILARMHEFDLRPIAIINTHGHTDHIGGNAIVKEKTGAPILIHRDDAPMLTAPQRNLSIFMGRWLTSPPADRVLAEGDLIEVGDIRLTVLHTPGHSPGGICLQGDGFILTGDTLFADSVGRTDLPGCSEKKLFESIRTKLLGLADKTQVYPGHGPVSSMGRVRRENPFVELVERGE